MIQFLNSMKHVFRRIRERHGNFNEISNHQMKMFDRESLNSMFDTSNLFKKIICDQFLEL